MRVCCPVCDTAFPIVAGFTEDDGKRLAQLMAEFEPALGRATIVYLGLFKPRTELRLSRAVKIAAELKGLVDAGTVSADDRTHLRRPATPALWLAGIEHMLAQRSKLKLPLDNHNYLRAVVFGLADKVAADAERAREQQLRDGRRSTVATAATPTRSLLTIALENIDHDLHLGLIATPAEAEQKRAEARRKYGSGE